MSTELIESTANMLRGMCMDPRIPKDTKEALWSRVSKLDAATGAALDVPHAAHGLQEVHAVQWYSDGGRTRCLEVFEDIEPARVFADHLPTGASAWITTMAVRGPAYAQAFSAGNSCGCREGTCESKPTGCRTAWGCPECAQASAERAACWWSLTACCAWLRATTAAH